ncbi:MAG TPA: hypothetical protein VEK13_02870 [Thermoplasmata archaeon]|nr:hypothetical protein [Thermoplasmata archaeon]
MIPYSHRDRRAHRTIWRGLGAVGAAVVALSVFVLAAPRAGWGILGVGGLIITGATYVVWSEGVLSGYAKDLRALRDGTASDGFLRAEAGSSVGLDRTVGRPTERSPHVRRRRTIGSSDRDPGSGGLELR